MTVFLIVIASSICLPLTSSVTPRTCDRTAAAEGLEARVFDHAVVADLELQLHHVAAFRRADDARADARLVLGEAADVARIVVVLDYLIRVSHDFFPTGLLPNDTVGSIGRIWQP